MSFLSIISRSLVAVTAAGFLLVNLGCGGSKSDHQTDVDPDTDFSKYRTYSYKSGQLSGEYAKDPFMDAKIQKAVSAYLPTRGLSPAPEGEKGDLTLTYSAGANTQKQSSPVSVGGGVSIDGPGNSWINLGANKWMTKNVTSGTVVVDLIDNATNKVVWRSYTAGQLQGKPTDENIRKGIEFFFKDYPPTKKK